MKKRIVIALGVVLLVGGIVLYRLCDGWTIIEMAAKLHSEWGSTNCGHVTNSQYHGETTRADAAIACVQNAFNHHQPFRVIFTGYGIDHEISNALVADSEGNAVELLHATGMAANRNRLLSHHCNLPVRLVTETDSPFGFSRLHCAEWPAGKFGIDIFIW
jgi:hypothetical protein